MKDTEVLAAMIATTAHRMGTTFSDTCLALLAKLVEEKESEKNKA